MSEIIDLGSKFIHAKKTDEAYGKPVYEIINKRSGYPISQIGWYPAWKRYVMFPVGETVFDIGCLKDICAFIESLTENAKAEAAK